MNKQSKDKAIAIEIKPPYANCWLKMARFKGTDKGGDFIDNQQEYCNVFRMLEIVDNFLHRHLPIASYFKLDQYKRIDKFALPVLAVREALVNAMCHRDYANRAGYISVAIFDNAIEIWSNGTLPHELKLTDLKHQHDSVLRNELIAKVFYLRGYIESWGTGIKKMIDGCKEHGIPAPKLAQRTGGFLVTFKFAEPIGISAKKPITRMKLSTRQEALLAIIKEHDLVGIKQIMLELDSPPSRRMVQKDLNYLKTQGLIEVKGRSTSALWTLQGEA